MWPGLLFTAHLNHFSEVPVASFLLVLAAPLCLGAVALLTGVSGRKGVAACTAATLLPLTVAIVLAEPWRALAE
jgi:hypothetical protein